jgi:Na+/citrate or Na+/malate symporter
MPEKLNNPELNYLKQEINKYIRKIERIAPIVTLYSEIIDSKSEEIESTVYALVSFKDYTAIVVGDPFKEIDSYPKKIFIVNYDGKIENQFTKKEISQKDLEYLSRIMKSTVGVF